MTLPRFRSARPDRRGDGAAHARAHPLFKRLRADQDVLVLSAWLVLVFLFGGGSRGDIQSLVFLRPAAALVLAYGLSRLTLDHVRSHRFLFGLAAASVGLVILHLVPLPPELWRALPARQIVVDIDRETAIGDVWRPLSLAPYATWNALWSLLVPLSVLVLGVQLTAPQRARLLPLFVALGVLSAVVGILQLFGDPKGPLYFYAVTNNGVAVGLFANRNHQAAMLAVLVPMILVLARGGRGGRSDKRQRRDWHRVLPMVTPILFLVPLVLVTGSRAGTISALLGLFAVPLVFAGTGGSRRGDAAGSVRDWRGRLWIVLIPVGIAALALVTGLLGRATAFDRLMESGPAQDLRVRVLPVLLEMTRTYAPWGSGFGSFEQAYRVYEPNALLSPFYMNHAHNDWLEAVLTGGIAAAVLLAAAAVAFVRRLVRLAVADRAAPDELRLARLGLLVVAILGFMSLSDYPLRVPSLACLVVVAAIWSGAARPKT